MTEKIGTRESLLLSLDSSTRQTKISKTGVKPANPVTTQNASAPSIGIRLGSLSPVRRTPSLRQREVDKTNAEQVHDEDHAEEFLAHLHIDPKDHETLKMLLGEACYTMIKNAVNASGINGMRHEDALHLMIEAAGGESTCDLLTTLVRVTSTSAGNVKNTTSPPQIKEILNRLLPIQEIFNGNARAYTKDNLLKDGVPKDCIGVLICTKTDPLASRRLLHTAPSPHANQNEEQDDLVLAVLNVDHENNKMLCCHFDSRYKMHNSDPDGNFFQISISAFDSVIQSRLIGGMLAIQKHDKTAQENPA